jgi:hypothetical protein
MLLRKFREREYCYRTELSPIWMTRAPGLLSVGVISSIATRTRTANNRFRESCPRLFAGESVTANRFQEPYPAGRAITDLREARGT